MGAIVDVAGQGRTMVLHGADNSAITALAGQQSVKRHSVGVDILSVRVMAEGPSRA